MSDTGKIYVGFFSRSAENNFDTERQKDFILSDLREMGYKPACKQLVDPTGIEAYEITYKRNAV